jgi:hypothetical protein
VTTIDPRRPLEISVWRVAGILHASIPRSVVRAPLLIAHRPSGQEPVPGHREFADLALNILNVLVPPQKDLGGDHEPVKCYRGHCSAFAERHHEDFARELVAKLPAASGSLKTVDIDSWIERRRRMQAAADSHDMALSA